MVRLEIQPGEFIVRPFHLWSTQWLVLASGDYEAGEFNAMTVGWGSIGVMWNKPIIHVVVRPTRYTFEFIERFSSFTVSAFPDAFRSALNILGTRSGREGDKIADAGLTPIASQRVRAPGFEEAELVIECEKIYWGDFSPRRFLDETIENQYPERDYHRAYFGKIRGIWGSPIYRR